MNTSENQSTATLDEGFTKTWRYKVGLSLIIVGHLIIILSPLVLPFLGIGAAVIGAKSVEVLLYCHLMISVLLVNCIYFQSAITHLLLSILFQRGFHAPRQTE